MSELTTIDASSLTFVAEDGSVVRPSVDLLVALQRLREPSDVYTGDTFVARSIAPLLIQKILENEPSPPRWVFECAARFGDERSAHAIGDWALGMTDATLPTAVAQAAVTALSRDGGAVALMQLQLISTNALSSDLATLAALEMELAAQDRGLRVWELEDTYVPTCGLGSSEAFPFDYGSQRFVLRLDPWLRPRLFDPVQRTMLAHAPEPTDGDDPAKTDEARARYARVCADVEDMLPVQSGRLESALVEQYRWRVDHWSTYLLGHPVMRLLIQRLVWGIYSQAGRCLGAFRVADDFSLTDADDNPISLPEGEYVGVLHPRDVGPEVLQAWSQLFSDYEIITVCPQFDRPLFQPPEGLRKEEHMPIEIEVNKEWGMRFLAGRRWYKQGAGRSWGWEPLRRVFRTADVRAEVHCTFQEDSVQLHGVSFHRHLSHPQHRMQLRDVPPVVFSESVREFEEMRVAWKEHQSNAV